MSSAERVLRIFTQLSYWWFEEVIPCPDSSDRNAIEMLISDYFNDVQSDDKNNHRNEGKKLQLK